MSCQGCVGAVKRVLGKTEGLLLYQYIYDDNTEFVTYFEEMSLIDPSFTVAKHSTDVWEPRHKTFNFVTLTRGILTIS